MQAAAMPEPAFFCAAGAVQDADAPTADAHKDFDIKDKRLALFRIQNFSWQDEGYTTMRRYLRDLPELLDKQFNTIAEMT